MKKLMILLSISIMCFMLVSCKGNEEEGINEVNPKGTSSIVSNNNWNNLTAEDEEYVYYCDFQTVRRISKEDNSVIDIFTCEKQDEFAVAMECFGDRIYVLNLASELISMDKDGKNIMKSMVEIDALAEAGQNDPITPYIYGENLYLISDYSGNVYRVDTETLTLELTDESVKNKYVTSDNTIFTKKQENDIGKLYVKYENEEEKLFSDEEESVLLNRVNYAEDYVYYASFKDQDFSVVSLYRVDLNGENKVLIKEFDMLSKYADVRYDNKYIYLFITDEVFLKIDKATLEETDITSMVEMDKISSYEIADEKFFQFVQTYFLDSKTGEKIEFPYTQE